MRNIKIICMLIMLYLTNGCAAYFVVADERSVGTMIDDGLIYTKIVNRMEDDKNIELFDYSVSSFNGEVFVVGEYRTKREAKKALAIAGDTKGVKKVTFYVVPKLAKQKCSAARNLKMMLHIKANVFAESIVTGKNVKVRVINCNAILWGYVGDETQMKKSIAHAQKIVGLEKVVNFIRIKPREMLVNNSGQ